MTRISSGVALACMLVLLACAGQAADSLTPLPCDVVDAEFDTAHARMILVSSTPMQLHRWDADTGALQSVDLPSAPVCVSISPDGTSAVVGHVARVTCVDLGSMAISGSWTIAASPSDIVHGDNGYAYVFPQSGSTGQIRAIRLADGTQSGSGVNPGLRARLRPGSCLAYAADTRSSPADIMRFALKGADPAIVRDSPYRGDFAIGGNLWFNDTGTRILTPSGNVFRATDDDATDMTYAGHLPVSGSLVWADHGGTGAGRFAVITQEQDETVTVLRGDGLQVAFQHPLPAFPTPGGPVASHGRWVFLSGDGDTAFAIVQADASGGLADDQGIVSLELASTPSITITSPASGSILGRGFAVTFDHMAWPPPAGGSVSWSLDGSYQGIAASPLQVSGLEPGSHTISIALHDLSDAPIGVSSSIVIEVSATAPSAYRLAGDVVDAEFDPATGRMVLVSSTPPRLQRWDATSRGFASVDLPATPTCVSISPDGSAAAVGHSASVTLIDLASMSAVGSWATSADAGDIVHGGNGFAYIFPQAHAWSNISTLNLSNGSVTKPSTSSLYGEVRARLRPGSTTAYASELDLSSHSIMRIGLSGAITAVERSTSYFGESIRNGNLWFNDAGTRILTRAGNAFRATDVPASDISYAGHIGMAGTLVWADHGGPGAGRFAVIPALDDGRLTLVDGELLRVEARCAFPPFPAPAGPVAAHGRWVFQSADGCTAYAVVQADAAGGLTDDLSIVVLDITPRPDVTITSPPSGSVLDQAFSLTFATQAWPPPTGGSVTWSLDGLDQGVASTPLQLSGLAPGTHTIAISLRDDSGVPIGVDSSIAVEIQADTPGMIHLGTGIVDVEFDAVHGRLIMAIAEPPLLQRWDAATGGLTSLELPLAPTCVSIAPDGTTAVLGHDARVTLVDLGSMVISGSWGTTAVAGDIVHGGNGFAYVFPQVDQSVPIRAISLADGNETTSLYQTIYAGTRARLRPGSVVAYGADNGLSPSDIERYALNGSAPRIVRNSPYHGQYSMGGNLWFDGTGARILTRSGNLFRCTDDAATDMVYAGSLPLEGPLVWADHGGAGDGRYAVIPEQQDRTVVLVSGGYLSTEEVHRLPLFPVHGGSVASHGRWIFLTADGNSAYAIVQADASAGIANNQAISVLDFTTMPNVAITSPASGAILGQSFAVTFKTRAWPPPGGGSIAWSMDGAEMGIAASPLHIANASPGTHSITISLLDHDGQPTGMSSTVSVTVMANTPGVVRLGTDVVDAEFDAAHARMILVSADPAMIHRWDAGTGSLTSIDLPMTPTCVSIGPDGSSAVVGHDARVTLIDIDAMTIDGSWTASIHIGDIVHAGNGFAYAFSQDGDTSRLTAINLITGGETASAFPNVTEGTRARLRPGSTVAYGAENGLSPSDIERYALDGAAPTVLRDSPYHGDHDMDGNLWFNDAGTRILTRAGNVFRSTDDAATDMTYAGRLQSCGRLVWADHGGSGAGRYAVIREAADAYISLYQGDGLLWASQRSLPRFTTPGGLVSSHGRWVFLSADGTTAYAVMQADAAGAIPNDQAIATVVFTSSPSLAITAPAAGAVVGRSFAVTFQTQAWPPPAGGSVAWTLDGADRGPAVSPLQVSGLAPGSHAISIALLDEAGNPIGVSRTLSVQVEDGKPGMFRLDTDVVDAEFDAGNARMVLVSSHPARLIRWEAGAGTIAGIDLPSAPTCVSVSPDGSSAVVGHEAGVTLVDLGSLTIAGAWDMTTCAGDIIHGGNGFAYIFPRYDALAKIHILDLASGVELSSMSAFIHAGTNARLRPGSAIAYGADNHTSPANLERYTLDGANPILHRDSPFHGVYTIGGNLWFDDAGTRILTRGGESFHATDDDSTDMTYAGRSQITGLLQWADHAGIGAGRFAILPQDDDGTLSILYGDGLQVATQHELPPFPAPAGLANSHGRWIFLSADGDTAYAIVQADAAGGLVHDQAIAVMDVATMPSVAITSPASGAVLGQSFYVSFDVTAWPPPCGGSIAWSLDGVEQGPAASPLQISGLAPGPHAITISLCDLFAVPTGVASTITVQVEPEANGFVRLTADVVDAEFDATHARMVLVGAAPPLLQSWSAASGALACVDLPAPPTCVSISPDGSTAVIGHDTRITVVDLASMTVARTWETSASAGDIVHGGDGFAYIFPRHDQWVGIHAIELATGAEAISAAGQIRAGTNARLRPGSAIAYGTNNHTSPAGFDRYALNDGHPLVARADFTDGGHGTDGNLWFNDGGTCILARSGDLFRSTDSDTTDMTYLGRIPVAGTLVWADHGGRDAGHYAVIAADADEGISFVLADRLRVEARRRLPSFRVPNGVHPSHGRFVFLSADGATAYAIVQADAAAGLSNDHAIVTLSARPAPPARQDSNTSGGSNGGCGAASGLVILMFAGHFLRLQRRRQRLYASVR